MIIKRLDGSTIFKCRKQDFLKNIEKNKTDLRWADLKWADLREANLSRADLKWADLRGADLRRANLRRANLIGANLDFSCWPLWCGSFDVKTDEKLRIQLAYHFCDTISCSDDATEEEKRIYNSMLDYVNRFHRTDVDRLEKI